MKLTNRFNLPELFYTAIEKKNAAYDKGSVDRSVTQLMTSPRIDRLRAEHYSDLTKDISDEVWAMMGAVLHSVLEEAADPATTITEERLFCELADWKISGAIDVQRLNPDGTISIEDYKLTTTFSVKSTEIKPEWVDQLNSYAYLVEKSKGIPVRDLKIIAIFRDWTKSKSVMSPLYPPAPIMPIEIPLWDRKTREDFLINRIRLHQEAEVLHEAGYELPLCGRKDYWEQGAKWAIKKPGRKRASSIHASEEEAKAVLSTLESGYIIEHRPGRRARCEGNWCQVAGYCTQWKNYQDQKDGS